MRQFMLPDLGEGLEEAEIVTWHVNEGDRVVVDQPLVSVETDKAVVAAWRKWYSEALESVRTLPVSGKSAALDARVAEAQQRLAAQ